MIRKISEEFAVEKGRLVILYVEEDGKVAKYRYLFTGEGWDKTEWIRLDHSTLEPSHAHVRRRTGVLGYVKTAISDVATKLAKLSDDIVEVCKVRPHG